MALGWHVIVRLRDDRVLAPSLEEQLAWWEAVRRLSEELGILSWRAADTHAHFIIHGTRAEAGELARRIQLAMQRALRPGCRFETARIRPIHDQRHLGNAFWYALRQAEHHGVDHDPWHTAGNLPDLLGLRVGEPWSRGRVSRLLPRVDLHQLHSTLGWSGHRPRTLGEDPVDLELLGEAAAAAVGVGDWRSRLPRAATARAAGVHLGLRGASASELGRRTGLARSTIRRARHTDFSPELLAAVEGQLAWRLACRELRLAG